jgi:hypothetical protein
MLCISRVTDERVAQRFGDNKHNFYLEARCNYPCIDGRDICMKCIQKDAKYRIQGSRKYDHGKVNEPIPDNSHIYGGKWYNERVQVWGEPSVDIVKFALEYQSEARQGYTVIDYVSPTKEDEHVSKQEMPPKKEPGEPKKKGRKPKVGVIPVETPVETPVEAPVETPVKPIKKSNKKINTDEVKEKKKRAPAKKKKEDTPTSVISTRSINYQEVAIPTYIETTMEEIDTDGYEIEYIKLEKFEINNTNYFREPIKNKLYKRVKDTIGPYIGRYYPDTETIDMDVPDSDEE